jgi:hypothetical protein
MAPQVVHRSGQGPGIGIVIFETTASNFPFHTAAVIDAPQGRTLYDLARQAACLRCDCFGADPGDWRVHRFDRALDPDQATRALDLAPRMPPLVVGLCCWGLTPVLSRLRDFADLGVWVLPRTLLDHLHSRPDLHYSTHLTPRALPAPPAPPPQGG